MRIVKGLVLAAAITPLLGACVIYDGQGEDNVSVTVGSNTTTASSNPPETLRSATFANGILIVRADSNGCTSAADFAVEVAEGDLTRLTLARAKPDLCKALVPEGVELRWTYAELGLDSGKAVTISNPVRLP